MDISCKWSHKHVIFCVLIISISMLFVRGFPGGPVLKNLPANAGDTRDAGSIPGSEDPLK